MSSHTKTNVTALLLLVTLFPALAQVPELINYQGRLVDKGALVNDNVQMSLRLYPSETGGTAAYEDASTVRVVDGLYATFIGDDTRFGSLPDALTNTEVWVEVEVDGTVLSPRERLVCVAYALVAGGVTNEAITSAMIRDKAIGAGKLDADCVDSDTIQDQSIRFTDIGNNGAARGQVMKMNEIGNWVPAEDDDSGVTDHGALTGLTHDDHTQYYPVAGGRMLSGPMNAGNNPIVNLGPATVANHALRYDQALKPGDAAGGGLAGTYPDPSLAPDSVTSSTIQDGTIRLHDINHDHADTGEVIKWSGSQWEPAPDQDSGVTDHGALTGLADNDHPQYLRSDAADIFNDAGANIDLRFEGDTDPNLLVLDASADAVGIGDPSPQGKLQVAGDEVRIGDSGNPSTATGDGDLYVEDFLEVDGSVDLGNDLDVADRLTVQGFLEVANDAAIGGLGTNADGPSETLQLTAQSAAWYLGVQNQGSEADSGLFIGKFGEPDGIFHIENNGSIGIGTSEPAGRLQVSGDEVRIGGGGSPSFAIGDGDLYVENTLETDGVVRAGGGVKVGSLGTQIMEIRELSGMIKTTSSVTTVPYPSGYNIDNTRVISASIKFEANNTRYFRGDQFFVRLEPTYIWINTTDVALWGQPYSVVILKLP